jgi:pimeloyl-ACP methyl ester carboxylesterase
MLGGWTSNVDYWAEDTTSPAAGKPIGTAAADAGLLTASIATDSTWGNSTIRTNVTTLVSTCLLDGYFSGSKVHLHGSSMGGLTALNWAYYNPTLVASISLVVPVVNVQSVYDRDPAFGMAASIGVAHGGRPPDSENPATASHMELLSQFPIRIYYSATDPITPVLEMFAFGSTVGAEMVSMGSIGHAFGSPYSGTDIADFVRSIEG